MGGDDQALAGRGIVVTRPAHQAQQLAALIAAAGGSVILFPTIEIVAVADPRQLLALIDRLDEYDLGIFISPNAAREAMKLIRGRRELPPQLKLATIGRGGVRELQQFGIDKIMAPAQFDSEALLDLPELRNVAGQRIVIFRGEGGRAVLGDTLSERGATVTYAECYRRNRPAAAAAPLLDAWRRNELHAVTATSSEGLRNLYEIVGSIGRPWLTGTPLFVPHPRIAQAARELGAATVELTGQGDEGVMRGLLRFFAGRN